jgi:hypothetical protein
MDVILPASDGSATLEIRNARVADADGHCGSLVRLHYEGELHRAQFWFDREDLQAFVREARWLVRSISGEAELDCLSLQRRAGDWKLAGRLFPIDLRFSFPISMQDADRLVSACEELIHSTIDRE